MAVKTMQHNRLAYGIYALVALGVMLPLLRPGFVLTLDMVFTPTLPMPTHLTSSYLFHAALHWLSLGVPSDVLEKIILLAVLLLSSIGMHRLQRTIQPRQNTLAEWGVIAAGIFYAINPFTYTRFMAGQYAVLLGYALLPWFARLLIVFGRQPDMRRALGLGLLAAAIGIVSIHTLGELAVLVLAAATVMLGWRRAELKRYVRYGLLALSVFVVASSYWLVPLGVGRGTTAGIISDFGAADSQAFATVGGSLSAKVGNVVRLQGFWADGRGLYLLPQDETILWGLMMIAILALVVVGVTALWRAARGPAALFVGSACAGVILAVGLGAWVHYVPLLAGYREPQKFVGLVALGYCVFLGPGATVILIRARERAEWLYAIVAVAVLLVPFASMRVMLWGFDGQLAPRHYPAAWSTVNQRLAADHGNFAVLALPWHQYMSFAFAGRIIANPAPAFFGSHQVLTSTDPELGGIGAASANAQQTTLTALLRNPPHDLSQQLARQNIKYIFVAKDLDYASYAYFARQPGMQLIANYDGAILYQNIAWRQR